MRPDETTSRDRCFSRIACGLIVLITVALYCVMMQQYPIIYGGDTIARLIHPSRIFNGHQLPLLQVLVYGTLRWFYGPKSIFILMAIISSLGCAGVYALTREITQDRRAACLSAIFYGTHPFILYYSRVPYQEPLLLAGTAWGFYYLFRPPTRMNGFLASLFIGMACLSRYEGWIAALVAALFEIRRNRENEGKMALASVARSLAIFGWAPALWIVWNRDLSPPGTYVLDLGMQWGRLYRPYFIIKSALWWTESAVVLAALIGFVYSLLDTRMRKDARFRAVLLVVFLHLAALIFSGHGIAPDPTKIVTEREAFIPVSCIVLYAGIGASWIIDELRTKVEGRIARMAIAGFLVVMIMGYSLNKGFHRVAASNSDPDLRTDFDVAQFLSERHAGGMILAAPLPKAPMESYLRSVEHWSGPDGRRKAEQLLNESETTPLDYQRVVVFSWMQKDKIFPVERLQGLDKAGIERFMEEHGIGYLIVFSDFMPSSEHERTILSSFVEHHSPALEIHNANRSAGIYPVRPELSLQ